MKNLRYSNYLSLFIPFTALFISILLGCIGQFLFEQLNIKFAFFLIKIEEICFMYFPLMLSASISFFLAKHQNGITMISGIISFIIITQIFNPMTLSDALHTSPYKIDTSFLYINNPIIGLLCGLLTAQVYNRFCNISLPSSLSFFSGKRSIPIITAIFTCLFSIFIYFTWPFIFQTGTFLISTVLYNDIFINTLTPTVNQLLSTFFFYENVNQWIPAPNIQGAILCISIFATPAFLIKFYLHNKQNKYSFILLILIYITILLSPYHNFLNILLFIFTPVIWLFHCICIGISYYLLSITSLPFWVVGICFIPFYYFVMHLALTKGWFIYPFAPEKDIDISNETLHKAVESLGDFENIKEMYVENDYLVIIVYDYEFTDMCQLRKITDWFVEYDTDFCFHIHSQISSYALFDKLSQLKDDEFKSLLI